MTPAALVPERPPAGPTPAFCFARTGVFEIEVGGRKLVGSAQRRQGESFLQHGAVLLAVDEPRVRALFPTTRDPLATLTTLEAALGRRPSFEAVADLCEMSARQDPALKRLADGGCKIAACYPRAVKWLFHTANAPLPIGATEVLNMRVQSSEEITAALFAPELKPNLPAGKETKPSVAELPSAAVA